VSSERAVTEALERYRWVGRDEDLDAHCVTVIPGGDPVSVAAAFAVETDSRRDATFAEQWDMSTPYPEGAGNDTVQIDVLGGAVVCLESNGWAGTDVPRAEALSHTGVYVSTYTNVNALMQLVVARAGAIVRIFDPLLYDPEGAMAEEVGLPFGEPGLCSAAAFVLLERVTGVELTRSWLLETPHPAYRRDPER
jgi:hypothetical protein